MFLSDSNSHSGLVTFSRPANYISLRFCAADEAVEVLSVRRIVVVAVKPYGVILLCIPLDTVHIFAEARLISITFWK
jgi:pyrroline-5-carboxylate reductase